MSSFLIQFMKKTENDGREYDVSTFEKLFETFSNKRNIDKSALVAEAWLIAKVLKDESLPILVKTWAIDNKISLPKKR